MTENNDDRRWVEHDRVHDKAEDVHRREHTADAKSLEIAVSTVDRRLGELNQLRAEVVTDRSVFVRGDAHRAEIRALETRIDAVEKLLDKAEGAANTWRWLAGFLGVGGLGAVVWALLQAAQ